MFAHIPGLSWPLIDSLAAQWWEQLGGGNGCTAAATYRPTPLSGGEAGHFYSFRTYTCMLMVITAGGKWLQLDGDQIELIT